MGIFTKPKKKIARPKDGPALKAGGRASHVCETCGKKCSTSVNLATHMRTHAGPRPTRLLGSDPIDHEGAHALLGLTSGRSAGEASGLETGEGVMGPSASEADGGAAGATRPRGAPRGKRGASRAQLSSRAVEGAAGALKTEEEEEEEEDSGGGEGEDGSTSHQRDPQADARPADTLDGWEGGLVDEGALPPSHHPTCRDEGGLDAAHLLLLLAPNHRERQVLARGLAKAARTDQDDGAGTGQLQGAHVRAGAGEQPHRASRAAREEMPSGPTRAP